MSSNLTLTADLIMNIRFFDTQLEKFIRSLDESTIAKVLRTIDLLEMFGHQLGLPHSKKVHTHLFELRILGKQEVRIFYTFHTDEAVLLHGFVKKSNRIPKKEFTTALQKLETLD
ncbi:type II toxin-antitoxin system RelE/ParE family toxin [Candidatus Wolfebacteria bacterium]|nr:type II toxin-antitoxin system RelE/ParE family toxin [Candidatus Wolfebacteria bacterium]